MSDPHEQARIDAEIVYAGNSNDPFASAVRATRMPMIVTDPRQVDNPIVFANNAFLKLTGYSREEILGRNCRFLQGPATNRDDVAKVRAAIADRRSIEIELLNYKKDGDTFWNRLFVSPVFTDDGDLSYYFASQFDTTFERERLREANRELTNSEHLLDALIRSSSEVRYRLNADWSEMHQLTGGSFIADTASPRTDWLQIYIPEDDRGRVQAAIAHAINTKTTFLLEHRVNRVDGTVGWMSSRAVALLDESGGIAGWFGAASDITDRKRAEAQLRESEERLRLVVEGARDHAILTTDLAGTIISWSAGASSIFGWSAEEIVGQPAAVLFTPEDRAADVPSKELAVAAERGCGNDERWHLAKDGRRVYMNGSVHPLPPDSDGRPRGFLTIARDETERRQVAEALRDSEQRYRTLFDSIDEGFCVIRLLDGPHGPLSDYVHIEANPAFEHHLGVGSIVGQTLRDVVSDEEAKGWLDLYGAVLRTGHPVRVQREFAPTNRHLEVSAHRIEPASRREIAVLFTDVTARKQGEIALRANEALARENVERVQLALAAGAIIGTWLWDLPNDRFTVDEAFARSFGLDPDLGREGIPLAQIVATVHPDDQAGLADAISEAVARGGAYAHQYRTCRADGNYYWLEANGRVYHAPDGTPLRFPGVLIDVEERRAVEAERDRVTAMLRSLTDNLEMRVAERTAELMTAEEALRQSQKMEAVGQLTGGVAHDFNNLLTIIRSSVDLLKRPNLPEARRSRYLEAVSETVDRAAKLTSQLLAFARRQALKPEVFDVGARLRGIGEMLDTVTGSRIKVIIESPDRPCHIRADISQFETALVNMAVNARDAMNGEGYLTLQLRCGSHLPPIRGHGGSASPFAAVSVLDTGVGIEPKQLGRIFEPFFTTKEVGKGTGLGLSQVFGFAKQSGGDVDVQSVLGQGTTFTLYLPEVEVAETAGRVDDPAISTPNGDGRRVLVVEDNVDVGRFCTQILSDLGYTTEWAANAEEALDKLGSDGAGFDVVFSDVVMPGMGGVALAETLRQRLPELPVLLASGYSHVLARETDHGFELLHKPYSAEQLARMLHRVMNRASLSRGGEAAE